MANGIGYKMTKVKKTAHQFAVLGRGEFPMDMLRYDRCYPKREKDTVTMRSDGLREVMLLKTINWGHSEASGPVWVPTVGRWNSFGWAVLDDLPVKTFGQGALTHNAMLIARLRQPMNRPRVGVTSSRHPFVAEARDGGIRPVHDGAGADGLRPDCSHEFP